MTKWSPEIAAEEEYGTRQVTIDVDNPTSSSATVVLRVDEGKAFAFVNDILGQQREFPFNKSIPFKMYAKSASISPAKQKYITDNDAQVIEYENHSLVTVKYRLRTLSSGLPGNTEIDEHTGAEVTVNDRIEGSAEFLTLQRTDLGWREDTFFTDSKLIPLKPGEEVGKIVPIDRFTRTISGLPYIDPRILRLRGHVNNAPYWSPYLGMWFEAETLLFKDPVITVDTSLTEVSFSNPNTGPLGGGTEREQTWAITISLAHKNNGRVDLEADGATFEYAGWNHFFRVATERPAGEKLAGRWERMFRLDEATNFHLSRAFDVYPLADFSPWLWVKDKEKVNDPP